MGKTTVEDDTVNNSEEAQHRGQRHLILVDRVKLESWIHEGDSLAVIANRLSFSRAVITKELQRTLYIEQWDLNERVESLRTCTKHWKQKCQGFCKNSL